MGLMASLESARLAPGSTFNSQSRLALHLVDLAELEYAPVDNGQGPVRIAYYL